MTSVEIIATAHPHSIAAIVRTTTPETVAPEMTAAGMIALGRIGIEEMIGHDKNAGEMTTDETTVGGTTVLAHRAGNAQTGRIILRVRGHARRRKRLRLLPPDRR